MRRANCHCGALQIECAGEPELIVVCYCALCQRRTGSSYNLGAWFPRSDVTVRGPERVYARTGEQGSEIHFHFCPSCGTNVYWEVSEGGPDGQLAVAAGCFADADFPAPVLSVYGRSRHRWLPRLAAASCFYGAAGDGSEE